MKTKVRYLVIFVACLIVAWVIFGCSAQRTEKSPTISEAERALATIQVQNTMSKHAYYHARGMQWEEMEAIWVSKDGKYAEDCHFANPTYIMDGWDVTWENYGVGREDREQASLDRIVKVYPEIENIPENRGIGHEWVMHTQTTPIIEIAGDGQTAKGVWYSPGISLSPGITDDGKVYARGSFFWEMYGCDFAKENGEWKIWHLQTFYDVTPPLPPSMTENLVRGPKAGSPPASRASGRQVGETAQQAAQTELPEGYIPNNLNAVKYEPWSPTRKPVMIPKLPEPYHTFGETFSY